MNQDKKSDIDRNPLWIFITLIIVLIGASPAFSDLVLDFFPDLNQYQKWIKLFFILIFWSSLGLVYWQEKHLKYDKATWSEADLDKTTKEVIFQTRLQMIFKDYPLNIITLKIIPLIICRIIRYFIKQRKYLFHCFNLPKDWTQYNEIKKSFFRPMLRLYIHDNDKNYEIKFNRDFQQIQLRFSDKASSHYKHEKMDSYDTIFSGDLEQIKIFSWITPFGLFWNLIRIIKTKLQQTGHFFKNLWSKFCA